MPKILINEIDLTSPGNPGDYSNYAVLLAGYRGVVSNPAVNVVEADNNGVYEFTSAKAFEDTIGLCGPKNTKTLDGSTITFYHYGNQMAYELLNLGYKVIYRPLEWNEAIKQPPSVLANADFWEIFKDKASYDFRFVSHGLLSSDALTPAQQTDVNRLAEVKEAIRILDGIADDAAGMVSGHTTDDQTELALKQNELYQEVMDVYPGFLKFDNEAKHHSTTDFYSSFSITEDGEDGALQGTEDEVRYLESQLAGIITDLTINEANGCIANLAAYDAADVVGIPGRGDCIALIELDEHSYVNTAVKPETSIISAINKMTQINDKNGKYCAMTVPSVVYKMTDNPKFDNNKTFPGAFHYLACFASALSAGFAEWYAAAGYTRGVSSYTIDHTSVKLGEVAINALEPRNRNNEDAEPAFACNVIANFRGSHYLWGNRTAFRLYGENHQKYGDLTASSFLNIRHLCTTLKKQLYVACRRFTFDPNSDTLWVNFVNAIRPTLDAMKADQGVRDYKIMKVVDADPKKATLKAKIRIIPIEAVEDFDLTVYLEDSFGETAAVVID